MQEDTYQNIIVCNIGSELSYTIGAAEQDNSIKWILNIVVYYSKVPIKQVFFLIQASPEPWLRVQICFESKPNRVQVNTVLVLTCTVHNNTQINSAETGVFRDCTPQNLRNVGEEQQSSLCTINSHTGVSERILFTPVLRGKAGAKCSYHSCFQCSFISWYWRTVACVGDQW
jgi:hypothetical protein